MKEKRKHWFRFVLLAFLPLVLGIGVFIYSQFGIFMKSIIGIQELSEGLFVLDYQGDYGFSAFLENGGALSDKEVADYLVTFLSRGFYHVESSVGTGNFGCSTLCLPNEEGSTLFGRNFDWKESKAMIVHTIPDDGYESFSTCCLGFLGFGDDFEPTSSIANRFMSLAAIYVPLDGMNEKGLMVADLVAGDEESTHQKRGKTPLTTTTALRLLLDHAADVEEALLLLSQYDMNSSIDSAHHFALADRTGRSVVVEYVDGEMLVDETRVLTNFYLTDSRKKGIGSEQSHLRYDSLMSIDPPLSTEAMKNALSSCAQKNYPQTEGSYEKTVWSIVYEPEEQTAAFYYLENYEKSYTLQLGQGQVIQQ